MTHALPTRRSSDRAGLLRHQPPLQTIGELGHCPLHVRELLVQKAAQAIQFVLVAEILRRDDFVIGGRPDVIIELRCPIGGWAVRADRRSEEHTSELQSLMRISYAVFCFKKK